MKKDIDYKQKYQELRTNFISATERAYSTGYEHGIKDGRQEATQMAQQQTQAQNQIPGQETPQPMSPEQMANQHDQAEMDQQESEVDQKIQELESILSGQAKDVDKKEVIKVVDDLNKSLAEMKNIKSRISMRMGMQKSERLKTLGKEVKQEVKTVSKEMNQNRAAALSLQKKMVDDLISKMEKESAETASDILKTAKREGLV